MGYAMRILSLGAGVQSSTLALMSKHGEIKKFDCAIFADTQSEPKNVYLWLDWLEKQLDFPVYRTTTGSLMEDSLKIRTSKLSGKRYMRGAIPAYVLKQDGTKGILGRQCTSDYKIKCLTRKTRSLCGWKRGEKRMLVDLCIGISYDEIIRMKPSREKWITHYWELIDLKMTRNDCIKWMRKNGYPEPPRSACVFCPFHSDKEWLRLKNDEPHEFDIAVKYEKRLQETARNQEALTGIPFLHNTCVPLSEVKFKNIKSHAQVDLFGNECEGLCGV